MKTAISVPDEIIAQAERIAKTLGVSRSELFTRAMKDFLSRRREIGRSYHAAFGDACKPDSVERQATRRGLLGVEWE